MKILLIQNNINWHSFYPPLFISLARELNKLGIEAKAIGYRELGWFKYDKIRYNKKYILKDWGINISLISLGTYLFWNKSISKLTKNLERININNYICKNKFDIIITDLNYDQILKICKKNGIKLILFSVDDIFYDEWFEFAAECDAVLCACEGGQEIYKNKGINAKLFRFFVDDEYFYPETKEKILDFVFIGRRIFDREYVFKEMIMPMINKFKNLHIFGFGFDDIKNCYVHRPLFWYEIPKIMNVCKISLNIHRPFFKKIKRFINLRTYETLACKTFLLTDYTEGIARLFEDRKELVIARNGKEMLELAEYYLNNEEKRSKIAENGYKKVIDNHTAKQRAKELYEIIRKI